MADLGPAFIGLGGAALGSSGTLLVAWLTRRSTHTLAAAARQEERTRVTRELAADGFVQALEAVLWLGETHVEDSVDDRFADEYVPKTERAVAALGVAREKLYKVSALQGTGELATCSAEVARLLGVLLDAWEGAQNGKRWVRRYKGETVPPWATYMFERHYRQLIDTRIALNGLNLHLHQEELVAGGIADGSALDQLRQALART